MSAKSQPEHNAAGFTVKMKRIKWWKIGKQIQSYIKTNPSNIHSL
jgi:hypothetical protein